MQFILTIVLATLWAKGGMWVYEQNAWLLLPYIGLGFFGGWFLQTEDEKETMRRFFYRWF